VPRPGLSRPFAGSRTGRVLGLAGARADPGRAEPTISKAGLDYFYAAAIGAEMGTKADVITLWNWPVVTVRVHGGSARSTSCVKKVIPARAFWSRPGSARATVVT
jgi:hypothetical protein